jgi:prepilin signal peptidase PulO-like enzyme (type II secretory pathway)
VLSTIDIEQRIVPNRIVLPAVGAVLALELLLEPRTVPVRLLAALGAALFFLVPALVRPGAVGMGDVKLSFLLGVALGAAVMSALFVGLTVVGVAALILVAHGGANELKRHLPLAPFLAFGAVVTLLLAWPAVQL